MISEGYSSQHCYILTMLDSDDFEVIGDDAKFYESVQVLEESKLKAVRIYEVSIAASKNEVDLSLLEHQYYNFSVTRYGQPFREIQRRYS